MPDLPKVKSVMIDAGRPSLVRRYRIPRRSAAAWLGVLLVATGVTTYHTATQYQRMVVEKVIDGDTLVVSRGMRVRLLGIDTPEYHHSPKLQRDSLRTKRDIEVIQHQGYLAWHYTRALVEGKTVRLEFDVERYDRYKRLLAYVFLPDGTFVNGKLVADGYAGVYTIPPNVKYAERLRQLQTQAREQGRGLWNDTEHQPAVSAK